MYEEVDPPPKSLYKPVGYNDMERVKIMMEGNDAEKRADPTAALAKKASIVQGIQLKKQLSSVNAALASKELHTRRECTIIYI